MFNMTKVLQDVVRRVSLGEAVYVKEEYRDEVSEELGKAQVAFSIEEAKANEPRVLFRLKKPSATAC